MLKNMHKIKIKKLKNQKRKIKKFFLSKSSKSNFNKTQFTISPSLNKFVHSRKKNKSQCLLVYNLLKINRLLAWKVINLNLEH
mmetsp:Transcript_17861/g.24972  ORF Transcript_17861/g.24972 Transcript_17861/m.24972 type:complete len:83 (-) Transcript_17861:453-701(-)